MPAQEQDAQHLRALVDMGSNGVRFSVSNLQPPTSRIMPTLYQNRSGISLYDAQYSASGERQPISDETINAVIATFKQFKQTCADFGVPKDNITVLATEATRTATNSKAFRQRIKEAVGWDVTLMSKEQEGRVGAMGIASSLPKITGLVMDLGGGSTQLSWLSYDGSGGVDMPEFGSISLPYGAAAMSRRLDDAEKNGTMEELKSEITNAITESYQKLKIPSKLSRDANGEGGFTLYLSGGGFRGWGYVLISRHRVKPYPIPIINGFKVSRNEFLGTDAVESAAATALQNEDEEIFRVSDRRASQVPAVAFLINALAEAIPHVNEVRFCQGGVREGYLFQSLSQDVQAKNPLVVATQPFSRASSQPVLELLQSAMPVEQQTDNLTMPKDVFTTQVLEAFANLIYYHSSHTKDLQASAALRCTTSGVLASTHGLLHESRTLLALLLCARWGGDIPATDQGFKRNLEQLIESPWVLWWINYIGAVAALIAVVYPAGVQDHKRLNFESGYETKDDDQQILKLLVEFSDVDKDLFAKEIKNVEKVGKKKNRIGGKDGVGMKVALDVRLLSR